MTVPKENMMNKINRLKELAIERSNLSILEADQLFKANKADELVWRMAGVAHDLIDMQDEVGELYPELVPFLQYLVRNYPGLKGK